MTGEHDALEGVALALRAGRVTSGPQTVDVTFTPVPIELADSIDEAYRAKYAGSAYLAPMLSEQARAAAFEVTAKP